MAKYDIVIIGAGIIGLATALKLNEKKKDLKIAVLEKEKDIASHQTGHNSGVIHAGVYYKPGSFKALNCREGYQMLIDFCEKENIKYELCGKLIVAISDEEIPQLERLYERSMANGLDRVIRVHPGEIRKYEPHAAGRSALYVPYTGITDYTEVCRKYAEIFTKRYGGEILTNNMVTNILRKRQLCTVVTNSGSFDCRLIVNTAGLYSDKIAELTEKKLSARIIPFRGEYYKLKEERAYLVRNLVYPVPDPAFPFLGVHFTRMINGGVEAGPNAVWAFKREGYKRSDFGFNEFAETIAWPGFRKVVRRYWKAGLREYYRSFSKFAFVRDLQYLIPEIKKEDLVRGNAGVRAQACDRKGNLLDDFLIVESENAFHVLNAPSPAATSSLAIGESLAGKIIKRFH